MRDGSLHPTRVMSHTTFDPLTQNASSMGRVLTDQQLWMVLSTHDLMYHELSMVLKQF